MATAAPAAPMTAAELVTALRKSGVTLRLIGGRVHYRCRGEVSYELLAKLGRRDVEVRQVLEYEAGGLK